MATSGIRTAAAAPFALTLALTAHCASGQVITRETDCGVFTGSVEEYREYLLACGTDRFARTIAEQRATQVAAAEEVTGVAAQRRRSTLAENPERVGEDLQHALDRAQSSNRRIAALPTRCAATQLLCDAVSARIEAILVRSDRTTLLDRAHIDAVVEELRFSLSDDVDEETAARLGRFIGATHVLVTIVGPAADAGVFIITARIIDVERTVILAASSRSFAP